MGKYKDYGEMNKRAGNTISLLLFRKLCFKRFSIVMAFDDPGRELFCFFQQGGSNGDIFFHHRAISFKKLGFIFL
jgi:hypothetical protein